MIELGYAVRSPNDRSGDRAVVVTRPDGMLVSAVDGLGTGEAAAQAADAAAAILENYRGEPLDVLLARCHDALRSTRGAVITVVDFDEQRGHVNWVGVGNVEARLVPSGGVPGPRPVAAPTLFGGVVGHQLPPVRASSHPVSPGDVLVMATDGVRADFADDLPVTGSPQQIADRVLARSARDEDDALVVVARWLGAAAA